MRSIFLTVFSLVCFTGVAQMDQYQKDIITYLNVNGTQQQYDQAYEDMFVVLKRNFETADIPNKVYKELKSDKSESLKEVTRFLSFAYRKHFTHEEIVLMTHFYKSDAAQKMLKLKKGPLSEAENAQINAYFDGDLAKKVKEKMPELSEDISEISGHWSRDLIGAKMSALVKMGYRTKF